MGTGQGLATGAIGLGTLGLAGGYGGVDADEAVRAVRTALDLGTTLIDTADFYGGGEVERLVGRAVAGRRDEAVIATRGGAVFTDGARPTAFDGSPAFLRRACDASLARLGTDVIDLYYLARPDPSVPVEETVGGLAALVEAGKVRHIGLSEVPAGLLRRAHAVHPVTALESEYSLWSRGLEDDVLPTARELGVGLVAHSPLGRGFLAGTLSSADQLGPADYRRRQERFATGNLARDHARLEPARAIARRHGVPLATLALAWLLAQDPHLVPIPGSRSDEHLRQNATACDLSLDRTELDTLAAVLTVRPNAS
ncbi:aldo/keto reductase [Kitasatospora sp. NPDC056446]|uniref:aldo/keto reductase n=1 Tax=Kitasatospora sp. NPDC056446 TaxID=3345819 RepID=UPI00369B6499